MTRFEYIENNMGTIKAMIRNGDVSTSMIRYYRIYCQVQNRKEKSMRQRILHVSDENRISEITVWRAIKHMEANYVR